MSDNNIKILEENNTHLWFENAPMILCSSRVFLDPDQGGLFACAKFLNIQPDPITSLTVDIICYDSVRQQIDCINNYTYKGLDIERNAEFGYNRRIPLRNPDTRNVEFVLKAMTNLAGQQWVNRSADRFNINLEQKNIYALQGDLNKQFIDLCVRSGINSTKFAFAPVFEKSHWMCSCGCFNWGAELECFDCGVNRDWLRRSSNPELLAKHRDSTQQYNTMNLKKYDDRLEAEEKQQQRAEFEERHQAYLKQQKKEKKKIGASKIKPVVIVLIILIAAAAAVFGIIKFVIPLFGYSEAQNAMSGGRYDAAITGFHQLNGFLDSDQKLLEAKYAKAESLYLSDHKINAAEIYRSIEDYSDAAQKYQQTQYEIAIQYIAEKNYIEAAAILEELGNYSNSTEKLQDCFEQIYQEANSDIKNNQVDVALRKLRYLGEYKNANELINECKYKNAKILYAKMDYNGALNVYNEIKGYKDTDDILRSLSFLADIISASQNDTPAIWSVPEAECAICGKKNSASYSLSFGSDGKYVFRMNCTNHSSGEKIVRGKYKIENNIVYTDTYQNGSLQWKELLTIKSVKKLDNEIEGKNAMMIISNPFIPSKDISLYGNVLSQDRLYF